MPKSREAPKSRRSARRRFGTTTWVLVAAGVVLVTLIAVRLTRATSLPGERFATQGNQHIADVGADHPAYNSNPPTSGWHVGSIAPWGTYDYVVPDELVLHNMEDGGVVLWYTLGSPDENRQRIDELQSAARGYRKVVIVPRENMPTPYAATAWQRLQRFDHVDADGVRAFLDAFEGIDHHE